MTITRPTTPTTNLTFRPGTAADSYTVFTITNQTLGDLDRRLGSRQAGLGSQHNPEAEAETENRAWKRRRSLYDHLARIADQFWLAEKAGRPIGFARSICHDGVRELTELFVLPEAQSTGVGRALLAKAFPLNNNERRCIIATVDTRAQILYLKKGVYPRFPIYTFERKPEPVSHPTDLSIEPFSTADLDTLAEIDRPIIGFRRDANHHWLLSNRSGYLYRRDGRAVGYGYAGQYSGPFALLDAADYPAVLAHAESRVAAQGHRMFVLDVPTINQTVVDYMLGRGCQVGSFIAMLMTDEPFGRFENYVVVSPMFIL